jgi:molybdate transport system substrate-binding protein
MHPDRRHVLRTAAVAALALALAGSACSRKPDPAADKAPAATATPPAAPPAAEDKLVVFAAASLREVFTALGADFQKAHPGAEVVFNFAGTQELRTQLEQGAAVDVFASADQKHMGELDRAARVADPVVFARNEPVIVVAREQVATVKAFADLPSVKRIVIGTPEVPIGRYTLQILDKAGADFRAEVEARVVSRELNVKQVLAKITLGEADVGVVYRTDAMTAKDQVGVVAIPPEINVIADYPIAVVQGAPHATLARAWVEMVLSASGQEALQRAGFMAPAGATDQPAAKPAPAPTP